MSSSEEEGPVAKRRRGIRNEESYRRNVIKKSKDSGKEHVNRVGKTISAKNRAQMFAGKYCFVLAVFILPIILVTLDFLLSLLLNLIRHYK